MNIWLNALTTLQEPAILVTVAQVEGSAPRASGASMVVTTARQFDTLGGGHLELRAVETAREMLSAPPEILVAQRRLVRFPLGPTLGQCCGGIVHLAFERIDAGNHQIVAALASRSRERSDSWRLTTLDAVTPSLLLARDGRSLHGLALPASITFHADQACHLQRDTAGQRWLIAPCLADRPQLLLFGAGHVGTALVQALSTLPCHVTWIDTRAEIFPYVLPDNITSVVTDLPETMVDAAPAGASFLVMTHSHALDQRLAESILRRADAGWFGLIGSKTKRMLFEHRLQTRGISTVRLMEMTCPIGLAEIRGKEPAVIAASVAAQLLAVWERQALAVTDCNDKCMPSAGAARTPANTF